MSATFFSWLGYWTGVSNEAGKGYGWWSGIGSCLTYLAIFVVAYRKLNCGVTGCYRLGFHHVDGTTHITCKKHHPTNGVTAEQIHTAHRRHMKEPA